MSLTGDHPDMMTTSRVAASPILDRAHRFVCLTVMRGREAGAMHRLAPGRHVIGRSEEADLTFEDDELSRRHVVLHVYRGGTVDVTDLGSTNGTWLDGERVLACSLRPGDKLVLGSQLLVRIDLLDELDVDLQRRLKQARHTDALTGCHNRRWFDEVLAREFALSRRTGVALALALIDIDHFKQINDDCGHALGDVVLQSVATALRAATREGDSICRLGGDEFAVLARATDADELARAITQAAAALRQGSKGRPAVKLSGGVAELTATDCPDAETLVDLVDQQLYRAKEAGRDRVLVAPVAPRAPTAVERSGRERRRRGSDMTTAVGRTVKPPR